MQDTAVSMWTPHDGSACPVGPEDGVIVIRRRVVGDAPDYANGPAKSFDWTWASSDDTNDDPLDDVVAWKRSPANSLIPGVALAGDAGQLSVPAELASI